VCGVSHPPMCDAEPSAQLASPYNQVLQKRETMRLATNLTGDVDDFARILNYAVTLLGDHLACLLVIDGLCCRKLSTTNNNIVCSFCVRLLVEFTAKSGTVPSENASLMADHQNPVTAIARFAHNTCCRCYRQVENGKAGHIQQL